ncbi:MAG TPA: hypothetical protein DCK96_04585 [Chloroflexi bacterium]|nr:hypothetical protein [Chloroflexota bacterium]HAL28064.1 hypothetical protein [Chloroflexota bacterium]
MCYRIPVVNRSGTQHRQLGERLLLVLVGADRPLSLRELARAAGVYDSSARYAVVRLVERGLVRRAREQYAPCVSGEVLEHALHQAERAVGGVEALRLIAAPNNSIAFLSIRGRGTPAADVVLSEVVEPREVVRLRGLAKRYLNLELHEHDYRELLGTTVEGQTALARLRQRLAAGQLVKGDLAHFPRPGVRGDFTRARPLHRANPRLPRLSRRTLQGIGRRYGVAGLSLFGSAARRDFRPDSDVDVLVRYQPGAPRTVAASSGLRDELSTRLGHRVDLVDERSIYPELRASIARDVVRLYGSRSNSLASRPSEAKRAGGDRRTRASR